MKFVLKVFLVGSLQSGEVSIGARSWSVPSRRRQDAT